jgi:hypothetical protein
MTIGHNPACATVRKMATAESRRLSNSIPSLFRNLRLHHAKSSLDACHSEIRRRHLYLWRTFSERNSRMASFSQNLFMFIRGPFLRSSFELASFGKSPTPGPNQPDRLRFAKSIRVHSRSSARPNWLCSAKNRTPHISRDLLPKLASFLQN